MAAKHRVGSKTPVKERINFVHEAVVAWLRRKIKYYFNGCFDSGAELFSICKFIPLSHSLYNFVITVTEIRLNIKENKYRVKKRTLCGLI